VLRLKPRAGVAGLLTMLLVGMFAAAVAEANQGPFWYHRAIGGQGKGVKLSGQQGGVPWEEVRGGGGKVVLEGKLAGAEVELEAAQVQVKGIVYNNGLQGQAKLEFAYINPKSVKPNNCNVTISKSNVVKVFGHQAWTWDGSAGQLKEQPQQNQKPDWLFTGQELQQKAKELPKGVVFTAITLSGASCAIPGTAAVEGSLAAAIKPEQVGAFSTSQTAEALEKGKQHFWNGVENVGVETEFKFGGALAKLKQTNTVTAFGTQGGAAQELGLWGD
jgi:hypothetical protein